MTYCALWSSICMSMSDWKDFASIVATIVAVPGVLFAAYKTWREVQRMREQRESEMEQRERDIKRTNEQRQSELAQRMRESEQREREHQLKRVEFTLAQHRRLFDDPTLSKVLQKLDDDPVALRDESIIEPKRKFLTFYEEMVLLINSGYIQKEVAFYMFGYYAVCAHRGKNFKYGIAYQPEYWNLFMGFAEEADLYLSSPGAKSVQHLRL